MRLLKKKNKRLYNKVSEYHQSDRVEMVEEPNDGTVARINDLKNNLELIVEKSRRGGYTLKIKKDEQEEIYFHSKYDPEKEAEELVDNLDLRKTDQVFILGAGLGYNLSRFVDNGRFDRAFFIEPHLSIFYAAILYKDLNSILKNKKIALLVDDEPNLYTILRRYYQVTIHKDVKFFEHSPSHNVFADEYKEIYDTVTDAVRYNNMNVTTNIKSTRKWRNNMIFNLRYILNSPKADDFFGAFEGMPAICVSAGPSLDKNVEQLKEAKGKALIMCVGTALKALLDKDIQPDIVVTMDGNKANFIHFKEINVPEKSFLFTEKANHYLINRKWTDKQVYFTMKRNLSSWIENMKGEYTPIQTGGTVAHSMVDMAYKFGTDPIVLVGQDLAYGPDKQTHATGTTYQDDRVNERKLFEVEDINGDKVLTSKVFRSFLAYFNDYFAKRPERTYIDATEGGAKIDHTEIMPLKEMISEYCYEEYETYKILEETFNFKKELIDANSKEYRIEIAETIKELSSAIDITKKQLGLISKIENKLKLVEVNDGEIKEIEKAIKEYEAKLKDFDRVKYFVERILIVESLKHKEIDSKYYMNKQHKLKDKLQYYRTYRVRYLKELENCLKLIKANYTQKTKKANS